MSNADQSAFATPFSEGYAGDPGLTKREYLTGEALGGMSGEVLRTLLSAELTDESIANTVRLAGEISKELADAALKVLEESE